jgi:hypothetical protein
MGKSKKSVSENAPERLELIKKLVVIAMFSDDRFMERLVLKGGNALDLIHRISTRASVDVDLSMDSDFDAAERATITDKVTKVLDDTFQAVRYVVFDVKVEEKPRGLTPDVADFWGGYVVEFKLAEKAIFEKYAADVEQLRRHALWLGQGSKFVSVRS